ncbi:MAG: hypothetical protein HY868_21850 [Chloroflexi bacterium]|nr:hypothetical protein [Chloroflexota bacterium]
MPTFARLGWVDTNSVIRYFLFLIVLLLAACAPITIPSSVREETVTVTPRATVASTNATPAPSKTLSATRVLEATRAPTRAQTIAPLALNYERNTRAIVIEADTFGGGTPMPRDAHVPMFRLFGDGLVVFAGEPGFANGLDASVRVGRLTETQIQTLLNDLNQTGFFGLQEYYEPRVKAPDQATATISVYLARAKTVRVYAPDDANTPQQFADAYAIIQRAMPTDAQSFTPTDGFLSATLAGSASEIASANFGEWKDAGVRLADVADGVTVAGNNFAAIAALVGKTYPGALFREGERVYRVRFAPNLPRAAHLTDWLGTILNAPREFDGRAFEIVGYFRGWNVYGEARGNPPVSRSDWVIADASGAIYVTGAPPRGLDPSARVDAWTVIRLRATVNYVRLGTSHLEARRVDVMPFEFSTPTPPSVALPIATPAPSAIATLAPSATPSPIPPTPIPTVTRVIPTRTLVPSVNTSDAAIAIIKKQFPEVAHIKPKSAGAIGASTDIKVILPRQDAWLIVFWEGWGDCPAGCINHRYTYFAVERDGRVTRVGEYSRIYNAEKNAFEEKGSPLWGVP